MGLFDKIKDAVKESVEQEKKAEQQKKQDVLALSGYVHDHIHELDEFFLENEGGLYPIKAEHIFGSPRTEDEIKALLWEGFQKDEDEDDSSFKEKFQKELTKQILGTGTGQKIVPYYIDTQIGRLHMYAGVNVINFTPKSSFDFYLKKKNRKIKEILDSVKSTENLTFSEIKDKIKICIVEITKEENSQLKEAWSKCVTSLIKMIPDPNPSEVLKEIQWCFTELKKNSEEDITEALDARVYHLIGLLEMPSAENAIRTIQEYERLRKTTDADSYISSYSSEFERKKQEVIEYAKINYMDEPSVKQYFGEADKEKKIALRANLIETLSHVGILGIVVLLFCLDEEECTVAAFIIIALWIVATFIYRKFIRSKYVKKQEE